MLNKIKLTNFRRHRDLSVTFGGGLTAIRALNEHGKTTLLEAISYAMFGVKAIRDGLDNVVTWGEATNTLKVELEISIDGVVYAIKRSKGGAEVNYDGGIVTGQNEVTAYVARLLKMDAGAAARLTLSNQNEIRGALEAGPKATTELIEKLADFDIIDQLIELMQEKLSLGSTASLEAGITSDEQALERAKVAAVPVDEATAEAKILEATGNLRAADADVVRAQQEEAAAQEAHSALREKIVARQALVTNLSTATDALSAAKQRLANLEVPVVPADIEGKVSELQAAITAAGSMDRARAAHKSVAAYLQRDPDALAYEGTMGELLAEIATTEATRSKAQAEVAKLNADIRVNEAALTHGSCTFCGKDFSGVPEVAAKNEKLVAQIASDKDARSSAQATFDQTSCDLAALNDVEKAARASVNAASAATEFVAAIVDNTLPTVYTWMGPDLSKGEPSVADLQKQIRNLQAAQTAYDRAVTQRSEVAVQVDLAQAAHDRAKEAVEAAPEVTLGDAQTVLDAARVAVREARNLRDSYVARLTQAESALRDQKAAYDAALREVARIEESLATRKADLKALEFNNALLKRVRQCRPLISDKLWNIVLSAVSSYFSEIRGVKSKVTKDSDGFKVDGHPTTSMSGSTLDALGLSIRIALVRTFLPSAPFLILDEPAAAMDGDRTSNMLGFLAACGFGQILLVTHEETSQDIADHVIQL